MKTKKSNEFKTTYEFLLLGVKALLAYVATLYQTIVPIFAYFVIDVIDTFYQKSQDDQNKNLVLGNFETLQQSSKQLQKDFDQMAENQRKYEREREVKENSLKFLNKLIAEGLIREKDLLSLTGTSGYYQVFVYSTPLKRLADSLDLEVPTRQYPTFLEELGFVRLGRNSPLFLINKNRLKNDDLKKTVNLKKFLIYHFSKIRQKEWSDFLQIVKGKNKNEYDRLKKKNCIDWGYLKYNFLLTETNMNPTNVGMVNDEYIGLGPVANNEKISDQILERSETRYIEVNRQLKVKIRKIIEKLDVIIMLDGVAQSDKNMIEMKQDIIKKDLNLVNIIELHKVNKKDLIHTLVKIGIINERAKKIALQLIDTTKIYHSALNELNITI